MLVLLLCAGASAAGASAAGVCVNVLVLNAGTCAGAGSAGVCTGAVAVRVLVLVASLLVLVRLVCVLVLKLQVRGT
jgi:hypothetical protein